MIESQIESKNFIGGEWVPADSGEVYEIIQNEVSDTIVYTTHETGPR